MLKIDGTLSRMNNSLNLFTFNALYFSNLLKLPRHDWVFMIDRKTLPRPHILASIRKIPTEEKREVCNFWINICPRPLSQHVRTAANNIKEKNVLEKLTKKKEQKKKTIKENSLQNLLTSFAIPFGWNN